MPDDFQESSEQPEWNKYWEVVQRRRWQLALPAFTTWRFSISYSFLHPLGR
jgi:hypothetical protein